MKAWWTKIIPKSYFIEIFILFILPLFNSFFWLQWMVRSFLLKTDCNRYISLIMMWMTQAFSSYSVININLNTTMQQRVFLDWSWKIITILLWFRIRWAWCSVQRTNHSEDVFLLTNQGKTNSTWHFHFHQLLLPPVPSSSDWFIPIFAAIRSVMPLACR